jgi:gas vesicle protein
MEKTELALTELGLIAGTRVMLGAGAGLLLADKLTKESRKAVGWTLLIVGMVSTIPLAADVFSNRK